MNWDFDKNFIIVFNVYKGLYQIIIVVKIHTYYLHGLKT